MSDTKIIKVHSKDRGEELGDLFGIFFEDLNHAADGGLYTELVQNRSFEFNPIDHREDHALTAWEKVERGEAKVEVLVENENPLNENNRNYLTLSVEEPGTGAGIMNVGFNTGIPVRKGENYKFSCFARSASNSTKLVAIALKSLEGRVYAQGEITV